MYHYSKFEFLSSSFLSKRHWLPSLASSSRQNLITRRGKLLGNRITGASVAYEKAIISTDEVDAAAIRAKIFDEFI